MFLLIDFRLQEVSILQYIRLSWVACGFPKN